MTSLTIAEITSMKALDAIANKILDDHFKERFDQLMINLSIVGFLIHVFLVFLHWLHVLPVDLLKGSLLTNPIATLYTPFTFILVFEVYLLIYYLPSSFTTFVSKQYEIISLIVVRRIFKDVSNATLSLDWFAYDYNIQLLADLVGLIVLFLIIQQFNRQAKSSPKIGFSERIAPFLRFKRRVSVLLFAAFIGLTIFSFVKWLLETYWYLTEQISEVTDINWIFYHEFFILLILIDVLVLIVSFKHIKDYNQLIRNTGFILSTVLIRMSFSAEGLINIIIIVFGVLFGLVIQAIYNRGSVVFHEEEEEA
ncbi:MAG: hypothetical protein AAGE93_26740 [Bacteroidota bacterium]